MRIRLIQTLGFMGLSYFAKSLGIFVVISVAFARTLPARTLCESELARGQFLMPIRPGIVLIPGDAVTYFPRSFSNESFIGYRSLFMSLSPDTPVEDLAKEMAFNGEEKEILSLLQKARDAGMPINIAELYKTRLFEAARCEVPLVGNPNCFGAAECFHSGNRNLEYIAHDTFENDLCNYRRLRAKAPLQYGDLLVFGQSILFEFSASHAATYIGGGYIFHKPSPDDHAPFVFEKLSIVKTFYRNFDIRVYRHHTR